MKTAGAASATLERSFFLARRVNTWLQSSMTQKLFNTIAALRLHNDLVDKAISSRRNEFGSFSGSDLH